MTYVGISPSRRCFKKVEKKTFFCCFFFCVCGFFSHSRSLNYKSLTFNMWRHFYRTFSFPSFYMFVIVCKLVSCLTLHSLYCFFLLLILKNFYIHNDINIIWMRKWMILKKCRSIYFLMLLKYYYIENVVCVNELC